MNNCRFFRNLLSLLLLSCTFLFAKGTIWQSQSAGYWSDGNVWSSGIAPPMSSADTIYVSHAIAIDLPLELWGDGLLSIDSTGGICGHTTLTMTANSRLLVHGLLELDHLIVQGGVGQCATGGVVILQTSASIGSNAQFSVNGMMAVGVWFQCELPLFSFLTSVAELPTSPLMVYPNPTNSRFTLTWESDRNITRLFVFDLNGRTILTKDIFQADGQFQADLEAFPRGYYRWSAMDEAGNAVHGSLVKQ